MSRVFYIFGWILVGLSVIWALFTLINDARLNQFAGVAAVFVACFYLLSGGALFVGIGAIIERLDRIVANGRSAAPRTRDDRR